MAKSNRDRHGMAQAGGGTAVQDPPVEQAQDGAVDSTPAAADQPADPTPAATANFTLSYRREHPGNRCSYGIAGVPGIVVFDRGLFADPTFNGVIVVDVPLALPKVDNKTAKAEAVAAKAQERAAKAAEKLAASQKKAADRAAAAQAKLDAARARVEAATKAAQATTASTDAPPAE